MIDNIIDIEYNKWYSEMRKKYPEYFEQRNKEFHDWCIEQYNKYPDMIEEEAKEEGVLGDIARGICKTIGIDFNCKYDDPEYIVNRQKILELYNYRCYRCNKEAEDVHHIKPVRKGGSHDLFNLVPLCKSCHRKVHNNINKGIDFHSAVRMV